MSKKNNVVSPSVTPKLPLHEGAFLEPLTLEWGRVYSVMRHIEGKLLTIVDASISDKEQCRAIKSLVKNSIWDDVRILEEWWYDPSNKDSTYFPFYNSSSTDLLNESR